MKKIKFSRNIWGIFLKKIISFFTFFVICFFVSEPILIKSQSTNNVSTNKGARIRVLIGLDNLLSEVTFPANNGVYRLNEVNEFIGTATSPQGRNLDRVDIRLKKITSDGTLFWNGSSWQSQEVWLPVVGKENWRKDKNLESGATWYFPSWEVGIYYNIVSRAKIENYEVYENVSGKTGNTFRFLDSDPLRIIPKFVVLEVGSQFQFRAEGGRKIPNDPDGYNWSSPSSSVGTVNSSGIFTSNEIGTTTVTVFDASDPIQQDTAMVVVIQRPQSGLILIPKYSLIYEGDQVNFLALDNQTGLDYCWKEDNEGSLRFGQFLEGENEGNYSLCTRNGDNTNVFKGITSGITRVRVTNSLGQTDTGVVVISKRTSDIQLVPEYAEIKIGEKQQYQVIGGVLPFTWISTEESIATVDQSGLATGLREGYTLIVVKDSEGNYDVGLLKVYKETEVDYFRLIPHSAILPSACTNLRFSTDGGMPPFMWGSSNNAVGVVDTTGFFMPLFPGNTLIMAKDQIDRYRQSFVGVTDGYPKSRIEINPGSLTIYLNETFRFTATGGSGSYTWEVTDQDIGSISQDGVFTSKGKIGQTSVVVKSGDETDVAPVFVFNPLVSPTDYKFTVVPGFAVILVGDKTNFRVLDEHKDPITWTVTDESVATIDQNGVLTPKSEGRATVIATDANGVRAFATIGVLEDCSDTLKVIPPYSEIYPGDQVQMEVEGGKEPFVWYSTRSLIATIDKDSGLVTAQNPGITVVYVMDSLGRTGYGIVKVLDPSDKEFKISPPEVVIPEGSTFQLTTINSDGTVVWETEDPSFVLVNQNGVITGVKNTEEKWITIRAKDASGKIATARVRVVAGNSKVGILIAPEVATLYSGQYLQLSYATDCEIGGGKITFVSLNPNVAIVDSNGKVTAISKGTSTIRVSDSCGNVKEVVITVIDSPKPAQPQQPKPKMPKTGSGSLFSLVIFCFIFWLLTLGRRKNFERNQTLIKQ